MCSNCHILFDHVTCPVLFFVPADLDFFIQFEKNDRKRRMREGIDTSSRRCPTVEDYRDHSINQGDITESDAGGLSCYQFDTAPGVFLRVRFRTRGMGLRCSDPARTSRVT